MKVLEVRNVEQAFYDGLTYLYQNGVREESRAGPVMVSPVPVTTVYSHPRERVLFNPIRDANPFFHLFESLFYLAGRQDIKWLDQFVSDFSARFAELDGNLHGSYGYRWRHHFDMEGGGSPFLPDQLYTIVEMLKKNPQDRQAVLTMWDPVADLGVPGLRDRPCNSHVYLRVRESDPIAASEGSVSYTPVLDITVCCRSNDLVWGAYGANAVQFSILQEYLAARIGVGVGKYFQISNNYHAYVDISDKLEEKGVLEQGWTSPYIAAERTVVTPIVTVPNQFDLDLRYFFSGTPVDSGLYQNDFFVKIAWPMYEANKYWKAKDRQKALQCLAKMPLRSDWRLAAYQWFSRRTVRT